MSATVSIPHWWLINGSWVYRILRQTSGLKLACLSQRKCYMDGSFNPSNSKNRGNEVNPDCWGTNHSVNLKRIIQYPGWSSNIAVNFQKRELNGKNGFMRIILDFCGENQNRKPAMDVHIKYFVSEVSWPFFPETKKPLRLAETRWKPLAI